MGLNTKISINVLEDDDELLWKAQKEVANPNENEIRITKMMW
jgi:hypothetical protein